MKAKGKKADFIKVAGETVEGLYYDKALNVYYFYTTNPTTNKRKKVTRRNKAKAALELYNYNLQNSEIKNVKIPFNYPIIKSVGIDPKERTSVQKPLKEVFIKKDGTQVKLVQDIPAARVPENVIIESFVEMLDTNPRALSEKFIQMGREDLAGIIHLPKNYKRSKTELSKMLEWYLTEEERSRDTIRYAKLFWEQFCDIVNVPYLEQVTLNHIKAYKQQLKMIKMKKKLSHKWLNYRYELVRRVVRHAKLHTENKSYINDVLDNMEILKATGGKKDNRKNPKPISKDEFQLMLNYFKAELKKANTPTKKIRYSKWIAIFLTGANTCSYFQDICDMTLVKKQGTWV